MITNYDFINAKTGKKLNNIEKCVNPILNFIISLLISIFTTLILCGLIKIIFYFIMIIIKF